MNRDWQKRLIIAVLLISEAKSWLMSAFAIYAAYVIMFQAYDAFTALYSDPGFIAALEENNSTWILTIIPPNLDIIGRIIGMFIVYKAFGGK